MKDPKSIKGCPVAPFSKAGDYFPYLRKDELKRFITTMFLKDKNVVTIAFYCRSEWDGLAYVERYADQNFPNQWKILDTQPV